MFLKTLVAMECACSDAMESVEPTPEVLQARSDDAVILQADAVTAEVGEILAASAALEEMADMVGECLKDGGLNPQAAAIVGLGLEQIYDKIGVYRSEIKVTLESFNDSPEKSTQVVLESIQEKIEAVWKGIVEMFKRFVRWLADYMGDMVNTVETLARRAEKHAPTLRVMKGSIPRGEISDEALLRRLYSPDVNPKQVVAAFENLSQTTAEAQHGLMSFARKEVIHVFNVMAETMNRIRADMKFDFRKPGYGPDLKEKVMDLTKRVGTVLFDGRNEGGGNVPDSPKGVKTFSTPVMLGGFGWYAHVPQEWADIDALQLGIYQGPEGSFPALPILSVDEMRKAAAAVVAMRKIKEANKATIAEYKSMEGRIEEMAEMVGRGQAFMGYHGELQRERTKVVRAILKLFTSKGMNGYGNYVAAGRDVLRLVELSMAKYEQPKTSKSRELVPA